MLEDINQERRRAVSKLGLQDASVKLERNKVSRTRQHPSASVSIYLAFASLESASPLPVASR